MRTIWKSLAVLCIALSAPHIGAQNRIVIDDETSNGVVIVTIDKAGDEIIRIINESQLPYFHDPQAPRFLLMDKKGKFALGIGGYVRATASYDFGGMVPATDFIPADIPGSGYLRNRFGMDASTANIFLKLVGHTDLLGDFIVYTAGNFRGDGQTFKLRNAYITFRNLTIGYNYGGFMDASALPNTIDFQGPNGAAIYRATQIAYSYRGLTGLHLDATIEAPEVKGTVTQGLGVSQQRLPAFTLAARYDWSESGHVRLAGVLRSMTYTSETRQKASNVTGWGVQASTSFTLPGDWRLFGQATYGRGISHYINDLGTLNADIVPDPRREGRMQALPMLGWYAAVQYNVTPRLFLSGTYSMARLYAHHDYPTADDRPTYRHGQYLAANAIWNVTPNMQVGAEYLRGWKKNFGESTRHANRVNLLVQYSF